MTTIVEFGNCVEVWTGVEYVEIKFESENTITLKSSGGEQITGTLRDMRNLAYVLIGMTDSIREKTK